MKKLVLGIITVCTLLLSPNFLEAAKPVNPAAITMSTSGENKESTALVSRVEEIKNMDKSKLNFKEKRALKKELRNIEKQLKSQGFLILSTGAVILIILLLILIL